MATQETFSEKIVRKFYAKRTKVQKENLIIHFGMLKYLLLMILIVTLAYSNHFKNSFHFDDSHTVGNNIFIRDIKNIPKFFTDARTESSLPSNQAYRPITTMSLAIDFWIGDKVYGDGFGSLFFFHLSTFIWYLVQLVLMYFIFYRIMESALKHSWNKYLALFGALWYGVLTSNAETINYIIARADSISTLGVVAGLFFFIYYPEKRKWFLYLIPVALGILAKPSALVFAPILFMYIWFFEKKQSLADLVLFRNFKGLTSTFVLSIPALVLCFFLYWFCNKMTPPTFVVGNTQLFNFIITQPWVILHYFWTFFLPIDLSADTDLGAFESMRDIRFFVGMVFILSLITIAFVTSGKARTRPIAFGIAWYFIALLPSSSIIPFAEVMNDHRIFFPFVGLMLSVCWTIGLLIIHYEEKIIAQKLTQPIILGAMFIIILHIYGTWQRNKVWRSEEALWYDVTVKSPGNGRGLMNYGLTKMGKGEYQLAQQYFEKALIHNQYYSYLYVNMGILKNVMGKPAEAEPYFQRALQLDQTNPEGFFYYANFLKGQGRKEEALQMAQKAQQLSPGHISSMNLINELLATPGGLNSPLDAAEKSVKANPTAEAYLNLSLQYYYANRFEDCIHASQEALKIRPDYAQAYNNMCTAYNRMQKWEEAAKACEQALRIMPDFPLAKNNLKVAKDNMGKK